MRRLLLIAVCLFTYGFADIHQINQIEQILPAVTDASTLVLLDMDDTLTDSSLGVGSGLWRRYIRERIAAYEKTGRRHLDKDVHDLLTLYVACQVPVVGVEESTKSVVEALHVRGIPAFVYTARGMSKWYSTDVDLINTLTQFQLLSAGLDFSIPLLPLPLKNASKLFFEEGIYYTSSLSKGGVLKRILTQSRFRPAKLVFVDDKREQVEEIESVAKALGIPFEGFYYTRAQERTFDPMEATQQLIALLFPEQEADELISLTDDPDMLFDFLLDRLDLDTLEMRCCIFLAVLKLGIDIVIDEGAVPHKIAHVS